MRTLIIASSLCLLAGQALAAGKDCEELKAEIAAKLDAKGVPATAWKSLHRAR